jgi:N-acetyl-anhydromuramyl-L-alanine amidase AmpD
MRFVQSPYFGSRGGHAIDLVVIHTAVGYYEGTIKYFQNNDRGVSAHYVVKEDGSEVCQQVDEVKEAYHAGIISNPNPKYYKGINPNLSSIGIENADNTKPGEWDRTGQYKALGILVRDICKRWNIPIDRDHICGHRELYDKKTCPGNIDVDKVVQLAKAGDFQMDDDTKRALNAVASAKAEFGYGNLEGTVNGLVGAQRDIVAVKNELAEYKSGEELRIKTAVDKAISDNNISWQSQLDSANKNIQNLTSQVQALQLNQADSLSYSTLFSIAWKKFWASKRG